MLIIFNLNTLFIAETLKLDQNIFYKLLFKLKNIGISKFSFWLGVRDIECQHIIMIFKEK